MAAASKEKLVFLIACFVLVFLIYGQTLWGDFVFDDRGILDHQYILSDLNNFHRVLALPYWTQETGLYRPITLASYTFNFVFLGRSAWGFHLVNLIIYALSGFYLFLFLKKFFKAKLLSYLAPLLFLVLPIHSEAVANIVGRAELLALFFSLLALNELIKEGRWPWKIGLWFLLAMGSKETAIAALPLALLVTALKEKKIPSVEALGRWIYPGLALLAGAAIYFGARVLVLGRQYFFWVETSLVENPLKFVPTLSRIATALKITVLYFKKTLWPFGLCSDYSYNQISVSNNFFNGETWLGLIILLSFGIGMVIFWKRFSLLSLGSAFFLFSFLPVANLFFPIGTIAGERLMYFPSVGICFCLAAGFVWLRQLKRQKFFVLLAAILFSLFIGFYGVVSFWRAGDWLTEKRLFVSAAQCAPNSVLSRSNLGAVYYLEGDYARAKKELLLSQQIYDGYPKGINNLGLVYWKEGDKTKARELFLKALSFRFPYYGAYENLALIALEEDNFAEAKKWLREFYSGNQEAVEAYIKAYQLTRSRK